MILQQIAHAVATNHPKAHLMVLLVDERPEEVTDMRRSVKGEVWRPRPTGPPASTCASPRWRWSARGAWWKSGEDVVILLDSITRLARAYNKEVESSGRTLTGGVDSRALERPKRIFGAARKAEEGGSLTILATALIDTGSRMDEVIFEEFKGTGNMEIILDRALAEKRIWPAINIPGSGHAQGREAVRREGDGEGAQAAPGAVRHEAHRGDGEAARRSSPSSAATTSSSTRFDPAGQCPSDPRLPFVEVG